MSASSPMTTNLHVWCFPEVTLEVRRSILRFLQPSLWMDWVTSCSVVERRVPHVDLTLGRFRTFSFTVVEAEEVRQSITGEVGRFEGGIEAVELVLGAAEEGSVGLAIDNIAP